MQGTRHHVPNIGSAFITKSDSYRNKFLQHNQIFSMNKKWAVKRITVNMASEEAKKLEQYCEQTGRPATDIIRELLRGLPVFKSE